MEPRGRSRTGLFLVLLVVLLGYLATRPEGGRLGGVESRLYRAIEIPVELVSGAFGRGRDVAVELFRREHLRSRMADLEKRLAEARLGNAALADAGRENERLATLLALKQQSRTETRGARVIGSDASGSWRSVLIDAGADDGVVKDAAVVNSDGLVGRVLKVGASTAVVQLVEDPSSGVGAVLERSRVQGVLVGSGRLEGRLKYIPNLEDVKAGDRVLASGLDGIYPKGVLVGSVESVSQGPDAFLEIRVRPAVSLTRLETVLVFVRPGFEAPTRLKEDLAEAFTGQRAGTLR